MGLHRHVRECILCSKTKKSNTGNARVGHPSFCRWRWITITYMCFDTLWPRQNGRYFPGDIFTCIFLNENVSISIKISLKFGPRCPINNIQQWSATSHYLNQWWLVYWRMCASIRLNELRQNRRLNELVELLVLRCVMNEKVWPRKYTQDFVLLGLAVKWKFHNILCPQWHCSFHTWIKIRFYTANIKQKFQLTCVHCAVHRF